MPKKHVSIGKTIQKIEYNLRWTGINIESQKRTYSENLKYKIIYLINFFWLNTDSLGAIFWFIQGVKEGVGFTVLTYAAPCITLTLLTNIKSFSIFAYENQINELISTLKELEIKENERPQFSDKDEIIKREIKFLDLVLKGYNFLNWSVIVTFPLTPIATMGVRYLSINEVQLLLPLLVVYPIDVFDIRYWPFVYIHHIWSVVLTIFETSGTDYLFYICSTYIRIQFHSLQCELEGLICANRNEILCENEEFHYKLSELIKWHQKLLSLVESLEVIYAKSTMFNFVFSSILICMTGFNVTTLNDKALVVSFLSFLLMSLQQIFFLCYFGDLLMRSSTKVSDAVYNCKWYLSQPSIRKKLHIIQIRAQKPCKVTAYGFADVNLSAFTKILSTSWSYFALLNTVYKE